MYLTTLVNVDKRKMYDAPYLIGCIVELTTKQQHLLDSVIKINNSSYSGINIKYR